MVDIRFAPPQDREEVVQFMQTAFPRAKWGMSRWQALLSGRWGAPDDPFALVVRDKGALVGVLGLVTANRQTASGTYKTANMTSWYVQKPYRGQGIGGRMLEVVTADSQTTITNFSSAKGAVPVVERAGFSVLDAERCVWQPSGVNGPLRVEAEPLTLGSDISARDRQVVEDHVGLNVKPVAVETPDGWCVIVLAVKQKTDAYVTHEVMYLGDRALFGAHARAIANSILPPERAVLSVDRRFVKDGVAPDAVEAFDVPRYYTAGRMPAADVENLYSEIPLLDLKMY